MRLITKRVDSGLPSLSEPREQVVMPKHGVLTENGVHSLSLPSCRALRPLPGAQVTYAGLLDQVLQSPTLFDGPLNFRRQCVRHVHREPATPSIAGQSITAVTPA